MKRIWKDGTSEWVERVKSNDMRNREVAPALLWSNGASIWISLGQWCRISGKPPMLNSRGAKGYPLRSSIVGQ